MLAKQTLKVWRVGGHWDVEAVISEPFSGCEDTLVRRISWSPDGQFLVATNSKDGVRTPTEHFVSPRTMNESPPNQVI